MSAQYEGSERCWSSCAEGGEVKRSVHHTTSTSRTARRVAWLPNLHHVLHNDQLHVVVVFCSAIAGI